MFRFYASRWCPSKAVQQYFAVFGLPITLDLSNKELQKRYHAAQKVIHPDKANANSNAESEADTVVGDRAHPWLSRLSCSDSVTANVAYETLKSPFLRAKYLSKLLRKHKISIKDAGTIGDLANSDTALPLDGECLAMGEDENNVSLPPAFLMECLEFNERVDELSMDTPEGKRAHSQLKVEVAEKASETEKEAIAAWNACDDAAFHDAVHRWTYFYNLSQQLWELE